MSHSLAGGAPPTIVLYLYIIKLKQTEEKNSRGKSKVNAVYPEFLFLCIFLYTVPNMMVREGGVTMMLLDT